MIRLTKFDNGLTLVTGNYPSFRSVAVGFWIGAGSAFETEAENGISHFTEHVMFKGSRREFQRIHGERSYLFLFQVHRRDDDGLFRSALAHTLRLAVR